jgi:uncharacterized protein
VFKTAEGLFFIFFRGGRLKISQFNVIVPTQVPGEYLLTNMMSGAVIGIDGELKSVIESGDIDRLDPDMAAHLESLGVFIPGRTDEYRMFKVEYEKRKYSTDALNFTLVTTYACNLACPYCYEGKGEVLKGSLNEDTRERAVKFIRKTLERTGAKRFSIALYGGEPLLNFDNSVYVMDSCFTWAEEKGIKYLSLMLTNGTLLTPERAEILHKYNMKSVQITLDGPKHIHDTKRVYKNKKGTYDDIMRSTGILLDHDVPVVFRVNIDAKNKSCIGQLLDELEEQGFKDVPLLCAAISEGQLCGSYSECIHDTEIFKTIAEAQRIVQEKGQATPAARPSDSQFFCGFLREGQYLIDPHADIYKCLTFVGLKEHAIGRINEEGEIAEYTPVYYDWMSRDPLTIKECRNCKILPACGGGCAAVAYERHKTYHACGCYDPSSAVTDQLQWFLEKRFPQHFKEGKTIWD